MAHQKAETVDQSKRVAFNQCTYPPTSVSSYYTLARLLVRTFNFCFKNKKRPNKFLDTVGEVGEMSVVFSLSFEYNVRIQIV